MTAVKRKAIMAHTEITIRFGKSVAKFYTDYHTAQFERALRLNGTNFERESVRIRIIK